MFRQTSQQHTSQTSVTRRLSDFNPFIIFNCVALQRNVRKFIEYRNSFMKNTSMIEVTRFVSFFLLLGNQAKLKLIPVDFTGLHRHTRSLYAVTIALYYTLKDKT